MTRANWTDEQLSALLDGELADGEMDALSQDIESDKALAGRLERLRGANAAYTAAIGSIDRQPVSAGLNAALAPPSARVIAFRPGRIGAFVMEHRAIAAGLICAAAVWGVSAGLGPAEVSFPGANGVILAASPLHRVLEETPSSVTVKLGGAIEATPRLTFATAAGGYCRQYRLNSGSAGSEAIACREQDKWRIEIATFGAAPASGDFVTAAGLASALDAFIDRTIEGQPLDAAQEAQAIEAGWPAPN
jgi:hypothetical protein